MEYCCWVAVKVAGEHIKGYCENENSEIRSIVGTLPKDRDAASDYMEKFGFEADYSVIFEKCDSSVGMMAWAIPSFRLPG